MLNLTSAWWMQQACSHVPNALLAVPHPNVAIMAKCAGKPTATGISCLSSTNSMHVIAL